MSGSVNFSLPSITLPHLGTATMHERIRWKGRRRRGSGSEAGQEVGRELPSPSLFKEEAQQLRKGERLGQKTLCLPLFNADGKSMLTGTRGDAPGPMGRTLVDEMPPGQAEHCPSMAHHYTSGTRTGAHPHTDDSPLPQAGPRNDPTTEPPSEGAQRASWVERTAQVKQRMSKPLKDKHLCLLTLRVNFITEFLTPAMAGARTSLGSCQQCLPV